MTHSPTELATVLLRVRRGDADAPAEFITLAMPLVTKIVRAYIPGYESVETWQHEVFVRAFVRLDQFRGDAPVDHWLSRLAVTACVDLLRQRTRRREVRWSELSSGEQVVLNESLAAPDGATLEAIAARELVDKLLASLEPDEEALLRMIDIQGLSMADAAELTGRSKTATKVRAFRARQKLREKLKQLLGEDQ